MIKKKIPKIEPPFVKKGSKWLELANLLSRKSREYHIIEDVKKDPALKKIHIQMDKIFSKISFKRK